MSSPIDVVLGRLEGVRGREGQWQARCPSHPDREASLRVKEAEDGRVLVHCHAGCSAESVVQGMGLAWVDLFPAGSRERGLPRLWGNRVPMSRRGRPALECMGDDVAAALIGEAARLCFVRGRLNAEATAGLRMVARALDVEDVAYDAAVSAALGGDVA